MMISLNTPRFAKPPALGTPASHAQQDSLPSQPMPAASSRLPRNALLSLLLHLLFALLLILASRPAALPPAQRSIHAVILASGVRSGAAVASAAAAQSSASASAAAPMRSSPKPQPQPKLARPTSTPASHDERAATAATSQQRAATSPVDAAHSNAADDDGDSLLSRLRGNWLAPPHSAPVFRCHLHVEYRTGGIVTKVVVQPGCGDRALSDSIERAVWKTQPLPLAAGSAQSGSLDLEFTP